MTSTTPSPISDQAAAQEAFELAWHRYDIYPTQYRDDGEINAYSDPVKEKAWRVFRYCSTAPTTGSAPTEINAVRYLKLRERMVMTVPPLAQGHLSLTALDDVLDAAPASPAANALTDADIARIGLRFGLGSALAKPVGTRETLAFARAVIAASMGGDKS